MTVNFANILQAAFSYQSSLRTIYVRKDFGAKAAHKMLVKLTPGGSMSPRYIFGHLFSDK